jgi:hypothetical protein
MPFSKFRCFFAFSGVVDFAFTPFGVDTRTLPDFNGVIETGISG